MIPKWGLFLSDTPQRFRLIQGDEKPKPYRARKRGEAELLACRVCEEDTGYTGSVTLEVKQGRMVRDGKAEGGTKAIICADCLARGKVTRLMG